MITSLLLWAAFALLSGVYDAGAFAHTAKAYPARYNPHAFFIPLRATVWALCIFAFSGYWWEHLSVAVSAAYIFPWIHDGSYYETRRRIDMPTYHWAATSTTSTARLTLTHSVRLALALAGVTIFLAGLMAMDQWGFLLFAAITVHVTIVGSYYVSEAVQRIAVLHGIGYISLSVVLGFAVPAIMQELEVEKDAFTGWDAAAVTYALATVLWALHTARKLST